MRSASSSTSDLHVAQVEHVLLEVVDDAARRADEHVDTVLERLALFFVVDAPEHDGPSCRPVCLPSTSCVAENLHRELARGREDQLARIAVAPAASAGAAR